MNKKTGILLLDFGGPDSLSAVRPFLQNLFSDRFILPFPVLIRKPLAWWIAKKRTPEVSHQYAEIGGKSPLPEQTRALAVHLEYTLKEKVKSVPVYYGMRYWHPLIKETWEKILADGVTDLTVIPLFPQFSYATTGSVFRELDKAQKKYGEGKIKISKVEHWYQHPKFTNVWLEAIRTGLKKFSNAEGAHLFFSAHSLPVKWVIEKYNDPYPEQIRESVEKIIALMEWKGPWHLAFQSKMGPVEWLGPATIELSKDLAKQGMKKVLFVPISFVSDHIETLFELEKWVIPEAKQWGLEEGFLTAPIIKQQKFVELLCDLIP